MHYISHVSLELHGGWPLVPLHQYTPDNVVLVQCVKPPEVVAETADVLNTLNCTEEATMLRG